MTYQHDRGHMTRQQNGQRQQPLVQPIDPRSVNLPALPVQDVDQVETALIDATNARLNVLAAPTGLTFIPPNYAVSLRLVHFSPEDRWDGKSNGTWYREGGGLVLHKAALRHLASLAGISWHVDWATGLPQFHWRCTARGRVRSLDGTWRQLSQSKEVDLTDGGAEVQKMERDAANADPPRNPAGQISGARKFGQRMCEEKAVNALIRAALGLRMKYSQQEARQPFCLPVLVYLAPDTPEVQAMQAAAEFGIAEQVYGQQPTAQVIDVTPEPVSDQIEPAQPEPEPRQIAHDPLQGINDPDWQQQRERREKVPAEQPRQQDAPKQRQADPDMPQDGRWGPDRGQP